MSVKNVSTVVAGDVGENQFSDDTEELTFVPLQHIYTMSLFMIIIDTKWLETTNTTATTH